MRNWNKLMKRSFTDKKFLCVGIDPPGEMSIDDMENGANIS